MRKVRIVGHRRQLDATLGALHRSRRIQLVDVASDSGVRLPPLAIDEVRLHEIEDLRYVRARLDALLQLVPGEFPTRPGSVEETDLESLKAELDLVAPQIESLVGRLEDLRDEQESLPRHLESLRRLLPLLPDMTGLQNYETTAILLDARQGAILGELNAHLTSELGGNFEMASDRLDPRTIGALLIYPRRSGDVVERAFGRTQVARIRLPDRYESVPLRRALVEIEHRLAELPGEIENAQDAVADWVRAHAEWPARRAAVVGRLEQLNAIRSLGATPHTFVISGWVPDEEFEALRAELAAVVGDEIVIEEGTVEDDEQAPVLMRNPKQARPFESFVKLLQMPRYGTFDPTVLMLIFLPLFFGMMLGDVVYGAAVVVISLVLQRHFRKPGFLHDLARVLTLCGAWAIVWGVVYGEYLGDLGHRLVGLEPLWINREEAIQPLLLFAIAIGAAHIVLGLVLGAWQAVRDRDRSRLGNRVGMLMALISLFLIAGAVAGRLPEPLLTPAVAALVVGVVLLIAAGGKMGLLMGPLELMGTAGHVLSYLRIAAIGLASVYLARVANELGTAAPLLLGLLIAILFHSLNLVLGMFSPTIQALRLHYVEFFDKFYEGGGQSFRPFGTDVAEPQQSRASNRT